MDPQQDRSRIAEAFGEHCAPSIGRLGAELPGTAPSNWP